MASVFISMHNSWVLPIQIVNKTSSILLNENLFAKFSFVINVTISKTYRKKHLKTWYFKMRTYL